MIGVFKKTFCDYFRGKFGWIYLSVNLFFAAVGVFYSNFTYYYNDFANPFLVIAFISVPLFPILSAKTFSGKEAEKDELLFATLPLSVWEILLGRYLAMLALNALPIGLFAVSSILLHFCGDFAISTSLLSAIFYLLFAGMLLAFCTWIAKLSKKVWKTVLFGIVALLAVYCAEFLADYLPSWLSDGILLLNPFLQFGNTVSGILDLSSLFYFVLFGALFLFASAKTENRKRSMKRVLTLSLAVLCVAMHLLCSFLPSYWTKFNLSGEKIYDLSEESKRFLSSLDRDVTLTYYCQNGKVGSNVIYDYFLGQYEKTSPHITVRYGDLSEAESGISNGGILVSSQNGSQAVSFPYLFSYYIEDLGYVNQSEFEYCYSAYLDYFQKKQAGESPEVTEDVYYGYYFAQYADSVSPVFLGEYYLTNIIEILSSTETTENLVISAGKTMSAASLSIPDALTLIYGAIFCLLLPLTVVSVGIGYTKVRKKK